MWDPSLHARICLTFRSPFELRKGRGTTIASTGRAVITDNPRLRYRLTVTLCSDDPEPAADGSADRMTDIPVSPGSSKKIASSLTFRAGIAIVLPGMLKVRRTVGRGSGRRRRPAQAREH